MAREIEPRFILAALPDLGDTVPEPIIQGYLLTDPQKTVRIRRIGPEAFITIKGPKTGGEGDEFEYPIPVDDSTTLLKMCGPENTLSKNRRQWAAADKRIWEVDEFTGRHEGLVIAEIELPARDTAYARPDWLNGSVDITDDFRFANAALVGISREQLIANIDDVFKKAGLPGPSLTL